MIVVAEIAMTAFHPGYCFREGKIRDEKHGEIVSESVSPK
jgi:hypothetical protein